METASELLGLEMEPVKIFFLDFNEARDDGVAVASAGSYASHLHLAPETMPVPHHSTFYRLYALPDAQPTVSKH